jgi:hypothetical protein
MFTIQVQIRPTTFEHSIEARSIIAPDISQEIDHGGWLNQIGGSEWQIADRSNLLLELACSMGLNRQVS